MRTRRGLVRGKTAASNRIHTIAEQLFPGFPDSSKSGVTPFCLASSELMRDRFSAPQIARRRQPALENFLRRHHVYDAAGTAGKILGLARAALPPQAGRVPAMQKTLSATTDLYACLGRNAKGLRSDAAR